MQLQGHYFTWSRGTRCIPPLTCNKKAISSRSRTSASLPMQGCKSNQKRRSISITYTFIETIPMLMPIQLRGPRPNGKKAAFASLLTPPSAGSASQRSGRYFIPSPQTALAQCMPTTGIHTIVPFGTWMPAMSTSRSAWRSVPEEPTTGFNRMPSFTTAFRYSRFARSAHSTARPGEASVVSKPAPRSSSTTRSCTAGLRATLYMIHPVCDAVV
mmetsp:Transcript_27741/g.82174  ORF Transcript_27741/g.82174 Transcript_27741/m.82174 type:complete len:214 (-) Transcript_27741:1263-1904(-)